MTATEVRFNLLPAQVTVTNKTTGEVVHDYPRSRITITDYALHAFIDTFDGPQEAFFYRLDDFYGSPRDGYTAESEDYVITFSRAQGCLCGSRLRGFNPFPGLPFVNAY